MSVDTFTCESCGETQEKGWSDAEAAAEAEELFPGIDASNPAEAGVVCDDCYQHIMGRTYAEAPELIGEGWRERQAALKMPIPVFASFVASLTAEGYTLNPCRDHCPDKADEHAHLRSPDGIDGLIWADGRVSEWDLTQPARLICPAAGRAVHAPPPLPENCYQMPSGALVHVKPGCRCK